LECRSSIAQLFHPQSKIVRQKHWYGLQSPAEKTVVLSLYLVPTPFSASSGIDSIDQQFSFKFQIFMIIHCLAAQSTFSIFLTFEFGG
jgi:hypothetical protein